jgi:hypothetical protein
MWVAFQAAVSRCELFPERAPARAKVNCGEAQNFRLIHKWLSTVYRLYHCLSHTVQRISPWRQRRQRARYGNAHCAPLHIYIHLVYNSTDSVKSAWVNFSFAHCDCLYVLQRSQGVNKTTLGCILMVIFSEATWRFNRALWVIPFVSRAETSLARTAVFCIMKVDTNITWRADWKICSPELVFVLNFVVWKRTVLQISWLSQKLRLHAYFCCFGAQETIDFDMMSNFD